MPRSEALNERLRDESRARIIEHALALFAERGFDRASIKMIATAAGISPGLVYHYFASKDQLLHAIFEQCMHDVQSSLDVAAEAGGPEQRIGHLVHASFRIVREHLPFWRLSYSLRMQPAVLAQAGDRIVAWAEVIRVRLEGLFREAGAADPGLAARVLFALIDGVAQHYALDPEGYPLDAVAGRIADMYEPAGAPALQEGVER